MLENLYDKAKTAFVRFQFFEQKKQPRTIRGLSW